MKKYISLLLPFLLTACGVEESSIGIIGGADGPTAIFVAATTPGVYIITAILLALITAAVILLFRWWKKRKK